MPTAMVLTKHREEDDAAVNTLKPDVRGEQHSQRQRDDNFEAAGYHRIDDGVAQPRHKHGIIQEGDVIVQADKCGVEQRPAG